MAVNESNETTKSGPANPQGSADLDAPTPPGGPMRSDAPSGPVAPGGPGTPVQPGQPHEPAQPERPVVEPSGDPDGPKEIEDPTAQTAQGEPSDDSGRE